MALESAAYINQLNSANPTGGDGVSRGDDHLRMLKQVLKNTFPGLAGPLTAAGVPSLPNGNLTATNVQAALEQLDSALSSEYFFNAAGVERYLATAGQTDFTILHLLYVPGDQVIVWVNGLLQDPVDAYTEMAAPAKGIVLSEGAALGDEVVLQFAVAGQAEPEGTAERVSFVQAGTGAVPRTAQDKMRENITPADFGLTAENSPFGKTGIRVIAGESRDAHYAWGSIVEIESPLKWVMIYRKATKHGTDDGAELRAADSYDFGESWVNDRLVQTDVATDSRLDKVSKLANGRIGFFCNRGAEAGPNKYPLFIFSDDGGVTWTKNEVPTSSLSYTFASVGGIISFPASQGGNNTTGFITFGYIDATGLDAFTTVDNGDTWSTVSNVTGSTVVSENIVLRVRNEDKWLCYVRATPNLLVYATTNLLNWGTSVDAGLENKSTPPGGFYDSVTDKIYYVATARAGKELDGYTNNLLYVSADADTLWTNAGVFTTDYKVLLTAPNWTTGYLQTFDSKLGLCGTFTAGENVSNGLPPSSFWLVGNFDTKGTDVGMFVDKCTRNLQNVNSLEINAVDNVITTQPLVINNAAKTASLELGAYRTYVNSGGGSYTHSFNNGSVLYAYNGPVEFNTASGVVFDFDGAVQYEGLNYKFGGVTALINNENAMLHLPVSGSTNPAVRSQAIGTASSRKHYVFHHALALPAAEVGSISTTTTATAFTTTSDETLKDFIGQYSGEEAIAVIKADPVREFIWKSTGEKAVGWGAQTSYLVSKDLATPGGWINPETDLECSEDTPGAVYIPWGVDQSKRTPYLWAAVAFLLAERESMLARIAALESK